MYVASYKQSCLLTSSSFSILSASGSVDILGYFLDNLENENDIDVVDNIHATPAHDAAEYGEMQAMLLLLQHGARTDIKDTVSFLIVW